MARTLTVALPDSLYERLVRAAELLDQPAEELVADSLQLTLPPVLDEVPEQYQADVLPLLAMSEPQLRRELSRAFPTRAWRDYEALLEEKRERALTEDETARLDALRRRADVLTLRRGYAAVLLKRRGASLSAPRDAGTRH